MIKHSLDVIQKAVQYINDHQVPVVAFDRPLYALAKTIQRKFSDYSVDKFVIMMGGLHIEIVMLKMIGDWLQDSGWNPVIHTSGSTEGACTADSF